MRRTRRRVKGGSTSMKSHRRKSASARSYLRKNKYGLVSKVSSYKKSGTSVKSSKRRA